jgi:hypothetical protein
MSLPPLYKYLDVNGAKLTLGNRTFRHTKPSTFKNLEDMTVQHVFPEEIEAALATLSNGCVDGWEDGSRVALPSYWRGAARKKCDCKCPHLRRGELFDGRNRPERLVAPRAMIVLLKL